MDWIDIAMVAFGAFIAGMFLAVRVLAWIVGLVDAFKAPALSSRHRLGRLFGQLVFHSGWIWLVVTIGVLFYVASLPERAWFWTVLSGIGLALIFMSITVLVANTRKDRGLGMLDPLGLVTLDPLTPELTEQIRRRFFWATTIAFGVPQVGLYIYFFWSELSRGTGLVFIAFIVLLMFGLAYGVAWFLWQFHSASLRAIDKKRRDSAARTDAV